VNKSWYHHPIAAPIAGVSVHAGRLGTRQFFTACLVALPQHPLAFKISVSIVLNGGKQHAK
jgi:hypothetical protein